MNLPHLYGLKKALCFTKKTGLPTANLFLKPTS